MSRDSNMWNSAAVITTAALILITGAVLMFSSSNPTGYNILDFNKVSSQSINNEITADFDAAGARIVFIELNQRTFTRAVMELSGGLYNGEIPLKPQIDILDDGNIEWSYGELFDGTATLSDFFLQLNKYMSNCGDLPCNIPIKIYSESAGRVVLKELNLEYAETETAEEEPELEPEPEPEIAPESAIPQENKAQEIMQNAIQELPGEQNQEQPAIAENSDLSDASEWRMFGRFLNHTRYNPVDAPAANLSLETIKIYTVADDIGHSSPTIANGTVYIGSIDNRLYALNASNIAQQLGNYTTGGDIDSSPAVADGIVYVGSDDNYLYALNASNISKQIANFTDTSAGDFSSSPAVADGIVYAGNYQGNTLYALNASNISKQIGNFTTFNDILYSSPAVANGVVYIGDIGYRLYALNASNVSQELGNYTTSASIYSSPTVANGTVYFGSGSYVYALNASNVSQLIGSYLTQGNIYSSPAVANGIVYVGSEDYKLYALNASNVSQKLASYSTGGWVDSSPAVTDNVVYVGSDDDMFYALNASNINQSFGNYTTGGDIDSSPAVVNGTVYVGSYDNKLYSFTFFTDTTPPSVYLTSPANATIYILTNNVTINITVTDDANLSNCTWWTNYTGTWAVNSTVNLSGRVNSTTLNFTNLNNGTYLWNAYCCDNSSNCAFNLTNYTFRINYSDSTPPIVFLNYPADGNGTINFDGNVTFNCSATATDGFELSSLDLYFDINGTWAMSRNNSVKGTSNSTAFIIDMLATAGNGTFKETEFKWNCFATNQLLRTAWNSTNFTVSGWNAIGTTYTNVTYNTTNSSIHLNWTYTGGSYYTNGTYESKIFNLTKNSRLINLTWHEQLVSGTNISLKIKVCSSPSCAGNAYNISCQNSSYCNLNSLNHTQYFQYKVILNTTNTQNTPRFLTRTPIFGTLDCSGLSESTQAECVDSIDNDCDQDDYGGSPFGVDCQDPSCTGASIDNADGRNLCCYNNVADCDPVACQTTATCNSSTSCVYTAVAECTDCGGGNYCISGSCQAPAANEVGLCTDGIDNDCTGGTDCADSDCLGQTGPSGGICCDENSDCVTDTLCNTPTCNTGTTKECTYPAIAHQLQDTGTGDTCTETCKECDGAGACGNQAAGEDLFTQCSQSYLCSDSAGGDGKYGATDFKKPSIAYCDGSGTCDHATTSGTACTFAKGTDCTGQSGTYCVDGSASCTTCPSGSTTTGGTGGGGGAEPKKTCYKCDESQGPCACASPYTGRYTGAIIKKEILFSANCDNANGWWPSKYSAGWKPCPSTSIEGCCGEALFCGDRIVTAPEKCDPMDPATKEKDCSELKEDGSVIGANDAHVFEKGVKAPCFSGGTAKACSGYDTSECTKKGETCYDCNTQKECEYKSEKRDDITRFWVKTTTKYTGTIIIKQKPESDSSLSCKELEPKLYDTPQEVQEAYNGGKDKCCGPEKTGDKKITCYTCDATSPYKEGTRKFTGKIKGPIELSVKEGEGCPNGFNADKSQLLIKGTNNACGKEIFCGNTVLEKDKGEQCEQKDDCSYKNNNPGVKEGAVQAWNCRECACELISECGNDKKEEEEECDIVSNKVVGCPPSSDSAFTSGDTNPFSSTFSSSAFENNRAADASYITGMVTADVKGLSGFLTKISNMILDAIKNMISALTNAIASKDVPVTEDGWTCSRDKCKCEKAEETKKCYYCDKKEVCLDYIGVGIWYKGTAKTKSIKVNYGEGCPNGKNGQEYYDSKEQFQTTAQKGGECCGDKINEGTKCYYCDINQEFTRKEDGAIFKGRIKPKFFDVVPGTKKCADFEPKGKYKDSARQVEGAEYGIDSKEGDGCMYTKPIECFTCKDGKVAKTLARSGECKEEDGNYKTANDVPKEGAKNIGDECAICYIDGYYYNYMEDNPDNDCQFCGYSERDKWTNKQASSARCTFGGVKDKGVCCLFGETSTCKDTESDRDNCGACGKQCAEGQACLNGKCIKPVCGNGRKEPGEDCDAGVALGALTFDYTAFICPAGKICNGLTCKCISRLCGNRILDKGEACDTYPDNCENFDLNGNRLAPGAEKVWDFGLAPCKDDCTGYDRSKCKLRGQKQCKIPPKGKDQCEKDANCKKGEKCDQNTCTCKIITPITTEEINCFACKPKKCEQEEKGNKFEYDSTLALETFKVEVPQGEKAKCPYNSWATKEEAQKAFGINPKTTTGDCCGKKITITEYKKCYTCNIKKKCETIIAGQSSARLVRREGTIEESDYEKTEKCPEGYYENIGEAYGPHVYYFGEKNNKVGDCCGIKEDSEPKACYYCDKSKGIHRDQETDIVYKGKIETKEMPSDVTKCSEVNPKGTYKDSMDEFLPEERSSGLCEPIGKECYKCDLLLKCIPTEQDLPEGGTQKIKIFPITGDSKSICKEGFMDWNEYKAKYKPAGAASDNSQCCLPEEISCFYCNKNNKITETEKIYKKCKQKGLYEKAEDVPPGGRKVGQKCNILCGNNKYDKDLGEECDFVDRKQQGCPPKEESSQDGSSLLISNPDTGNLFTASAISEMQIKNTPQDSNRLSSSYKEFVNSFDSTSNKITGMSIVYTYTLYAKEGGNNAYWVRDDQKPPKGYKPVKGHAGLTEEKRDEAIENSKEYGVDINYPEFNPELHDAELISKKAQSLEKEGKAKEAADEYSKLANANLIEGNTKDALAANLKAADLYDQVKNYNEQLKQLILINLYGGYNLADKSQQKKIDGYNKKLEKKFTKKEVFNALNEMINGPYWKDFSPFVVNKDAAKTQEKPELCNSETCKCYTTEQLKECFFCDKETKKVAKTAKKYDDCYSNGYFDTAQDAGGNLGDVCIPPVCKNGEIEPPQEQCDFKKNENNEFAQFGCINDQECNWITCKCEEKKTKCFDCVDNKVISVMIDYGTCSEHGAKEFTADLIPLGKPKLEGDICGAIKCWTCEANAKKDDDIFQSGIFGTKYCKTYSNKLFDKFAHLIEVNAPMPSDCYDSIEQLQAAEGGEDKCCGEYSLEKISCFFCNQKKKIEETKKIYTDCSEKGMYFKANDVPPGGRKVGEDCSLCGNRVLDQGEACDFYPDNCENFDLNGNRLAPGAEKVWDFGLAPCKDDCTGYDRSKCKLRGQKQCKIPPKGKDQCEKDANCKKGEKCNLNTCVCQIITPITTEDITCFACKLGKCGQEEKGNKFEYDSTLALETFKVEVPQGEKAKCPDNTWATKEQAQKAFGIPKGAKGDCCGARITKICGNGKIELNEQCEIKQDCYSYFSNPNFDENKKQEWDCDKECQCKLQVIPPPPPIVFCGDGKITPPEKCEKNADCKKAGETCVKCQCKAQVVPAAFCGDGIITPPEKCEQNADCQIAAGEKCVNCQCQAPLFPPIIFCGDGVITPPEKCEKNADCNAGEICDKQCKCKKQILIPLCGNGIIEAGERCEIQANCKIGEACVACQCQAPVPPQPPVPPAPQPPAPQPPQPVPPQPPGPQPPQPPTPPGPSPELTPFQCPDLRYGNKCLEGGE